MIPSDSVKKKVQGVGCDHYREMKMRMTFDVAALGQQLYNGLGWKVVTKGAVKGEEDVVVLVDQSSGTRLTLDVVRHHLKCCFSDQYLLPF